MTVKKPSDTGRQRQLLLKKVVKSPHNQFASAVLQRKVSAAGQAATEIVAMEKAEERTILADASHEKKGYKVSGNKNLPSERFWSKPKEMRIQTVAPK